MIRIGVISENYDETAIEDDEKRQRANLPSTIISSTYNRLR